MESLGLIGLVILIGWILGIVAFFKTLGINYRMDDFEDRVEQILDKKEKKCKLQPESEPMTENPQGSESDEKKNENEETRDPYFYKETEIMESNCGYENDPEDEMDVYEQISPQSVGSNLNSNIKPSEFHTDVRDERMCVDTVLKSNSQDASKKSSYTKEEKNPNIEENSFEILTSFFSFEQNWGTKWMVWIGIIFMVIGSAYFLKYTYDNNWIGPTGRIAIGVLLGTGCIVFGNHFRKKDWGVLFQSLTGGGIAILYACVFFSFKIYNLTSQAPSFCMAAAVTLFAISMAVKYDAVSIALLAEIGGFLSPILISSGENHPHVLFPYLIMLNLITIFAAYFRQWRALDILAFVGTAIIYQGWQNKFAGYPIQSDLIFPAVLYLMIFNLIFLLVPTIYSLHRRISNPPENIIMIIANSVFSSISLYFSLYPQHNYLLSAMYILQAVILFILFKLYIKRLPEDRMTGECLLIIGTLLSIIVIPILFEFYIIPIFWALESVMLLYLDSKYGWKILRYFGMTTLILAVIQLLGKLPLHNEKFIVVLNAPFCSWLVVSACAFLSSFFASITKKKEKSFKDDKSAEIHSSDYDQYIDVFSPSVISSLCFFIGFALMSLSLSMEGVLFWRINNKLTSGNINHAYSTLIAIWCLLAHLSLTLYLKNKDIKMWGLTIVSLSIAGISTGVNYVEIFNAGQYISTKYFLNFFFPLCSLFPISLWLAAKRLPKDTEHHLPCIAFNLIGQVFATILLGVETMRWANDYSAVSEKFAIGIISALWALQCLVVSALGLIKMKKELRAYAFTLFAIVCLKVCFVDMTSLDRVYRIISFAGSGLFFVIGGYFYQKFSKALLNEKREEEKIIS